jgi:hypothetical protein
MKNAEGCRRLFLANRFSSVVFRPLMQAIQGKLIRIIKEACSTGTTCRPVKNRILIAKPFDFLVEMIWGENGEL